VAGWLGCSQEIALSLTYGLSRKHCGVPVMGECSSTGSFPPTVVLHNSTNSCENVVEDQDTHRPSSSRALVKTW
jgi:hypothetical protein